MKTSSAPRSSASALPRFDCACATLRRTARLLTQLYDEELRPSQVEASQFALLTAIERRPGLRQADLARAAGFDKTTLSRNLSLMRRKGWIETPSGEVGERGLQLTAIGQKLLRSARPGWNRAQQRLQAAMPAEEWDRMLEVLDNLTTAAVRARQAEAKG